MSRRATIISQLVIDFIALTLAFTVAFVMRFDWQPPADMAGRFLLTLPYVVILEYGVFRTVGAHRYSWRYIGLREVSRILVAMGVSTLLLVVVRLLLGELQTSYPYLRHGVLPLGVIAANFFLSFLAVAGVRVTRRLFGERAETRSRPNGASVKAVRTMLVGAGQAGVLVAKEILQRPDLGVVPVGFLDDDVTKRGTVIHGIPVLGNGQELAALCAEHNAEEVLITMANVPGEAIRRIRTYCRDAKLPVKIIPGLYEIVGGQVNLSRIRKVAIEDLLGREPVALDTKAIASFAGQRTVMVTGAGGSIGSELCRQLCRFGPKQLILVERSENALFHIHRELLRKWPEIDVVPCMADVTDAGRIGSIMAKHQPSAVFHAAAHKHVPLMESNPAEAIKNNVFGSMTVADAAHEHGCDAFVMVSTDKAVNPSSVMGATKRIAELYVQSVAERSSTRFVTVRFGNVLGSAGSVIPIFREQIARGGPVMVTHPDMRRYFMTIPEACQLVLQAGTIGASGDIMLLDMGEPVKIVDLARDLISLSGLREGEDIEIEFSGTRPGEKLFEELATDAEHAEKTAHPKIFVGRTQRMDIARVRECTESLMGALERQPAEVRAVLRALVPEFQSPEDLPSQCRPQTSPSLSLSPVRGASS